MAVLQVPQRLKPFELEKPCVFGNRPRTCKQSRTACGFQRTDRATWRIASERPSRLLKANCGGDSKRRTDLLREARKGLARDGEGNAPGLGGDRRGKVVTRTSGAHI